jgi:spore maturation protein A
MLNYLWGGLIIISLVFALVNDGRDIIQNTWKNGDEIDVILWFPVNTDLDQNQPAQFQISGDSLWFEARWRPSDQQAELVIPVNASLPDHWKTVAEHQESSRKQELRVAITQSVGNVESQLESGTAAVSVVLPEVNFIKLRAITAAAFSMAETAVTLALGLIGIMALWLGLMKIAEQSGLIMIVVKGVRPMMKWLFPEIPKDHPAMGMVSLNLAANILGLGNAATPLGIKAMEELQKLNPDKDSATNSMCMFLALNTSSVQLLPPVTLVAIMGLRVNELMVAITITTLFSTIAAILVAKWYAKRNKPTHQVLSDGSIVEIGTVTGGQS